MAINPPTPKMGLVKPTPGGDLDQWGLELNDNFDKIDGYGPPYSVSDLDIQDDLTINGNDILNARAIEFDDQLTTINDEIAEYSVDGELYWNDGAGNKVKITNGGIVNTSGGTYAYNETTINANTTIAASDPYNWYNCNTSGSAFTLTLPQASDVGNKFYWIKDTGNAFNTHNLAVATQGGDTFVDHAGNLSLKINLGAYQLVSDGVSKWSIVVAATYENNLGNYIAHGTLSVDGGTTLGSTLTTTGTATFNGNATIGSDEFDTATIKSTLGIQGPTFITGDTSVIADLAITGATTIEGTVDITGAIIAHTGSPITAFDDVSFGTHSTHSHTVDFYNTPTFHANTTIADGYSLTVSGDIIAQDDLTVSGTVIVDGSVLNVHNDTILGSSSGDTLTVNATATLGTATIGTLTVNGDTTLGNGTGTDAITFNNTTGVTTINSQSTTITSAQTSFQGIVFPFGDGNRFLEPFLSRTTSGDVDIKYKNVIVPSSSGTVVLNITADSYLNGDWMYVCNKSTHTVEITCDGGSVLVSIGAPAANLKWYKIVNTNGTSSGWTIIAGAEV